MTKLKKHDSSNINLVIEIHNGVVNKTYMCTEKYYDTHLKGTEYNDSERMDKYNKIYNLSDLEFRIHNGDV